MPTAETYQSWLDGIDCKLHGLHPVTFRWIDHIERVRCSVQIINSRRPEQVEEQTLFYQSTEPMSVDALLDEMEFVREVYRIVATLAAHEAMEWTYYKGRMLYDPHVMEQPSVRMVWR